jgi:hypothetical protein
MLKSAYSQEIEMQIKPNLFVRTIRIFPKQTAARTQYYEMSDDDSAYVYRWLMIFLCNLTELATHDAEYGREFMRRRPGVYPKGQHGPNSLASMIAGIAGARIENPQHNISEPQLDALVSIFNELVPLYEDQEQRPERIEFEKVLNRVKI